MTGVFITNLLTCIADISNLTVVSNVCKAVPMSLFWASNRFNGLLEMHFEISLQSDWQIDLSNAIFNRPIMVCTQILGHRWRPITKSLALFHKLKF